MPHLPLFFRYVLHLFWWAHIGDIDFMALPKWIMQGFQYHRLSEPARGQGQFGARLKHVQRLRWRSGRWKFLTRRCCISHIWRLKMNGLSQLCIEKKWWNCLVSKNAQKKLGRRLVESDFCAEHEDKTSRRLPRVADGQDTFWKKRTEVQNT